MSARTSLAVGLVAYATTALTFAATITVPGTQPSIADALAIAASGDVILVDVNQFDIEPVIDWRGKSNRVISTSSLFQPGSGVYRLGDGAAIETDLSSASRTLTINGELRSASAGISTALSRRIELNLTGRIIVQPAAELSLAADLNIFLNGTIQVQAGGTLSISFDNTRQAGLQGDALFLEQSALTVTSGLDTDGVLTSLDADVTVSRTLTHTGDWLGLGGRIIALEGLVNDPDGEITLTDVDIITAGDVQNFGSMELYGGSITADVVDNRQTFGQPIMVLDGVSVFADLIHNRNAASQLFGYGVWQANLDNFGAIELSNDTTIEGDVFNADGAQIVILRGSLTIYGDLFNDGTIVGDVINPLLREARTFYVGGDFFAGPAAGLVLPTGAQLRVRGSFDAALTDNAAFDLSGAALTMDALTGATATLERMSTDIGPYVSGFDRSLPGRFPLAALTVANGTVDLVDVHDNDLSGDAACEAVYVGALEIAEGATLNTNGCPVYYATLINNGIVDNLANLIEVGPNPLGDLNGDARVDLTDLALLLADYDCVAEQCVGDVDGDGDTDLTDLALLLSNFDG